MNNDLISRSALLNERPEYLNTDHIDVEKALFAKGWNACAREYYSVIDNAPAVDAEVVRHGRWIAENIRKKSYLRQCSVCNKIAYFCGTGCSYNYCPNCGVKMDAEVEIQPKWISVDERLPEKGQKVIVCGVKNGMQIGAFRGIPAPSRSRLWWWKENTLLEVTHWKPLPEPPKEEA